MAEVRIATELKPPEPPPESRQLGAVVWLRKNLFNSPFNSILTVLIGLGVIFGGRAALGFLLSEDRRWEVIPPNSANYAIEAYPRESLARIWLSLGIVVVLAALSMAVWRVEGRVLVGKVAAAVRSAGVAAIAFGLLAPGSFDWRVPVIVGGAVLVVVGWIALRALGERAHTDTVSVLSVVAGLVVLVLAVLWLLPIATTTKIPYTIIAVIGGAAYYLGRAATRFVLPRTLRGVLVGAWFLSLPVIYLQIQRAPVIPWDRVRGWLPWMVALLVVGLAAIRLAGRLGRDRAAVMNAVLVVAAMVIWFFDSPMIACFLLSLVAVFALATPTFGTGERGQRTMTIAWIATWLVVSWLIIITVASPGLETRGEYLGGLSLTFLLAIGAIVISFPIGIALALGRTSSMPIFRLLSTAYIEVIRGVPLITVLFFGDKVIPRFLPPGLDFAKASKALIAMALFSAAYLAENVRGGLQSIPKGQYEAARALGMTTSQMTMLITLPQALRAVIPAIVGQVIAMFKDTSLVAIIGLADFFRVARDIVPNQPTSLGSVIENLVLAAIVYWVFTFSFSRASQRLERKLGVGTR